MGTTRMCVSGPHTSMPSPVNALLTLAEPGRRSESIRVNPSQSESISCRPSAAPDAGAQGAIMNLFRIPLNLIVISTYLRPARARTCWFFGNVFELPAHSFAGSQTLYPPASGGYRST